MLKVVRITIASRMVEPKRRLVAIDALRELVSKDFKSIGVIIRHHLGNLLLQFNAKSLPNQWVLIMHTSCSAYQIIGASCHKEVIH